MAKFKKGQKVKLVNLEDWLGGKYFPSKSNKVGNTGTITGVYWTGGRCSHLEVRWDNGTANNYIEENLVHLIMEDND